MMKTTQILMDEHQVILSALERIETIISSVESMQKHLEHLHFYFDFIGEYSDELHHKKEEDIYFAWISENHKGLKEGPIACMLREHETLRDLKLRAINNLGLFVESKETAYLERTKCNLAEFIGILRAHINKEDTVLYKMAEELNLSVKNGDDRMLPEFEKVQSSLRETIEKYAELV